MIYRILIVVCCMLSTFSATAQKKAVKKDMYIYFKIDTAKYNFKMNMGDTEVYNYRYIKGNKEYSLMLFSPINKNKYCVTDSTIFSRQNVLPYENLEKIKGLIADQWLPDKTPFNRVFIVERLQKEQYKVVEVQIYAVFNSEGVRIRFID